jgi:hypothetical protein
MTPAQLEHLKLIDAHLERLLAIAEKRTPGDYVKLDTYVDSKDNHHGIADFCYCGEAENEDNASYFASCAGNAEAGWKATRAAIALLFAMCDGAHSINTVIAAQKMGKSILAAFPLESLK